MRSFRAIQELGLHRPILQDWLSAIKRAPSRRTFTSTPQFTTAFTRPVRPSHPNSLLRRFRVPQSRRSPHSRHKSTGPDANPSTDSATPDAKLSLSQRLRKLSREYGWSALGVYLALSALDFPFCFMAVRIIGTERIGHLEHVIVSAFWKIVPYPLPVERAATDVQAGDVEGVSPVEAMQSSADTAIKAVPEPGWGVEEAQEAHKTDATIWTQLALAYAIHKSFIFLRVPLTAAVTPKVVKVLRGWGWNIGKRPKMTGSSE